MLRSMSACLGCVCVTSMGEVWVIHMHGGGVGEKSHASWGRCGDESYVWGCVASVGEGRVQSHVALAYIYNLHF